MRNSRANSTLPEDDYIISPVRGRDSRFFDSRHPGEGMPQDADANGAYNIARKGGWLLERISRGEKAKMTNKDNNDWLQSVQKN